jgi:hypothetical protein
MIARQALYDYIEALINASSATDALNNAVSFRRWTGSVDEAIKVVRVDVSVGNFTLTENDNEKERNVEFTVQCHVLPDSDSGADMEAASDESFAMARQIFTALASDSTGLGGFVCDCYSDEFEMGEINIGATRRACTYLDGMINKSPDAPR